MNESVDWNLVGKYVLGECSEEESARIQRWIEEDPARKTLLEELRQVLNLTRDPDSSQAWDTTALWNRIEQQTGHQEPESAPSKPAGAEKSADREPDQYESGRSPRTRRDRRRPARSAARFFRHRAAWGGAIALTVATLAMLWLYGPIGGGLSTTSSSEAKTFATQKGQRAHIRLTDGTQVQLNVDSRLEVPADFGDGKRRTVRLKGEAFFEVTTDSTQPFIVRAGDAVTRVLGTAFDVSAYPEDEETRVIVTEGRVALRADKPSSVADASVADSQTASSRPSDVVLAKRQMARILRNGKQVVLRDLNVNQHLAWMEGRLAFEKASFNEVVRKLERWYGLMISFEGGEDMPHGRLNAQFTEDRPLHEVLHVVATAYGLEYERREERVTFTPVEGEAMRRP